MNTKTVQIISLGLIISTGVGVYFLMKADKNKNTPPYKTPNYIDAEEPTTNQFNPKSIANDLYNAMVGFGKGFMGNDQKQIFESIAQLNNKQFALVFKAFGQRYYNPTFGTNRFLPLTAPTKHSLKTWLKTELSDTDYRLLKNRFTNYL